MTVTRYPALYLAGIRSFNDRDFFASHEQWEDLWRDTHGRLRDFYKGLIQAAVALYHFTNGNLRGARKLYQTSRNYLRFYEPFCEGLDVTKFLAAMAECCAALMASTEEGDRVRLDPAKIPTIVLAPPPAADSSGAAAVRGHDDGAERAQENG